MAGIYLHIPFCKQACAYCNFHFATSLHHKQAMVQALQQEIRLRVDYLAGEVVDTIYLGGGTPSLLAIEELKTLLETIRTSYAVSAQAEITLEANPDDINEVQLQQWKAVGINRLSIGVQSFREEDLQWMHRAHNAHQSLEALRLSKQYFDNITIDLIYGVPGLSNEDWKKNIENALSLNIPHLSCYALTVEPKTPLEKQIRTQQKQAVDPDTQAVHFLTLIDRLEKAGFRQYEISNFAKPGFESKHNQSYWQGKSYLGIGPSAHSYNGTSRQWNVANNQQYISAIEKGTIPFEIETLTPQQQCNEYIMTALRTDQGIQLERLGPYEKQVLQAINPYIKNETVARIENRLMLTREGKFLADGIAAALFVD